MRKILFIAHYFPPLGGAGVQRSAKMVKYLPSLGFGPLVLTLQAKGGDRWTPLDSSAQSEIPSEVRVFRAAANSNPQLSAAQRTRNRHHALVDLGSQIIRAEKPDLIFVTMSPFADASVASELALRHGLPWIADLRDPWALDEFQVYRTRWHRARERRKMGQALKSASSVVMNTPSAAARFRSEFPFIARESVTSITNGYDPSDFIPEGASGQSPNFTIVHSGYFHADIGLRQRRRAFEYKLLGRALSGVEFLPRSHFYLIRALEQWLQRDPTIISRVRVVCVGSATDIDKELVQRSPTASMFQFTGYLPHAASVEHVQRASLLFLPMHKMPPGVRATIVPGKTYEYMASGRPILAAVPEGDAKDFVQNAGSGLICEPDDIEGMITLLRKQFSLWQTGDSPSTHDRSYVERFARPRLAEALGDHFLHVLSKRRPA